MKPEAALIFPIVFGMAFVLTLLAGVYLVRNDRALFGPHADHPSETESGRSYNKMQVWAIWGHAVFLTGAFALFLH